VSRRGGRLWHSILIEDIPTFYAASASFAVAGSLQNCIAIAYSPKKPAENSRSLVKALARNGTAFK
jgi:hypothetical protein